MDHLKCEQCFYSKPRGIDPGTGEFTWGLFCYRTDVGVLCRDAFKDCEDPWLGSVACDEDETPDREQLRLEYATRNKRKR